jgi:hypothetical protein
MERETSMTKEQLYDYVKNYLEGAMKPKVDSDFGRGYQQGLRSLKQLLEKLETGEVAG